jgi:hypothetical protein
VASNDWKKKNYNSSVKVSSSTIADLKAGKTFEGNVAKFKSGATAEQREAMNRFYGKSRVDSALGSAVSSVNKTYPGTTKGGTPGAVSGKAPSAYKAPSAPKSSGSNFGNGKVGSFVKNELLGADDFSRTVKYAKSGDFGKAAKSLGTGAFELGTTAAAVVGSVFTGGAAGGALVAAKTAQVAGRQAGKTIVKNVAKQGGQAIAKNVAKTTVKAAGKTVKAVATGSVKSAPKTVKTGLQGAKKGISAAGRATSGARTQAKMGSKFVSAQKNAARANAKASSATLEVKQASEAYRTLKAGVAPGKSVKGLGKAYDARKAAITGARESRTVAVKASARVGAMQADKAKKLASAKKFRRGVRRAQYAHLTVMANEKR